MKLCSIAFTSNVCCSGYSTKIYCNVYFSQHTHKHPPHWPRPRLLSSISRWSDPCKIRVRVFLVNQVALWLKFVNISADYTTSGWLRNLIAINKTDGYKSWSRLLRWLPLIFYPSWLFSHIYINVGDKLCFKENMETYWHFEFSIIC